MKQVFILVENTYSLSKKLIDKEILGIYKTRRKVNIHKSARLLKLISIYDYRLLSKNNCIKLNNNVYIKSLNIYRKPINN